MISDFDFKTNVICFAFLLILLSPCLEIVHASSGSPTIQWSKTYGSYVGLSVIQTTDGGFAVAGQKAAYKPFASHSPAQWENYTALLFKTDENGNLTWEKTYESQGYGYAGAQANSVVQTNDQGYALCGYNWFLKLDAEGNIQWNMTFSNLELCLALQTKEGGYAIVGNANSDDASASNYAELIKTDQNGDIQWSKIFSLNTTYSAVYVTSLQETKKGGFALTGSWNGNSWFAETDANGTLLFNKTYNLAPSGLDWFSCVSETADEGYILAGTSENNMWTAWVVKTDAQGNAQWNFHYQQSNTNLLGSEFFSVAQMTDGGYVAVGIPSLVKLDSSGKMEWNMTGYLGYSVVALSDGFVVAGALGDLAASNQTLWVAKITMETGFKSD